jgi:stalled ribosome rescue protein Dom34
VGLVDGSYGNIAELLVTDRLFKAADFKTRTAYVQLVESVKSKGGKVVIRVIYLYD